MDIATFRSNLTSCWKNSLTDLEFAQRTEAALTALLASCLVGTTDFGVGISPSGSYAGTSSKIGALTLKSGLADALLQSWQQFVPVKIGDVWCFSDSEHSPFSEGSRLFCDSFAKLIAEYISGGNVSTTTVGLITVSASPPYTVSASADATGSFTGTTAAQEMIASSLLEVFTAIEQKATQNIPPLDVDSLIAPCVDSLVSTIPAYISSGRITIQFANTQIEGTGSGSVS